MGAASIGLLIGFWVSGVVVFRTGHWVGFFIE